MLALLEIKNYALIKELSFCPSDKFTALTGETGSGKSILLGALGLLMGKRADTTVLLDNSKKCIVEGTFDIKSYNLKNLFESKDLDYFEETSIRREIVPSGKSRAFINDTPVTLETLKELTTNLMDIHSQNDNLQLQGNEFQRNVIDSFGVKKSTILEYKTAFKSFQVVRNRHKELLEKKDVANQTYDYNLTLLKELESANLDTSEWDEIQNELSISQNLQEIIERNQRIIHSGIESEFSVNQGLTDIITDLNVLADYSEDYKVLLHRFESSKIELNDILAELYQKNNSLDFDESRVQYVQEKSDLINSLLFKHKLENLEELIKKQEVLKSEIDTIENFEQVLSSLEREKAQSLIEVNNKGLELRKERGTASNEFSKQLSHLLKGLGMENNSITVKIEEVEPHKNGCDQIEILFSANKGIEPKPLKQVASGGEFSRLLFCIKNILASKTTLPTIIFDEIDTGISGHIARKMGSMMVEMGKHHQVISITHLPQVASLATSHFHISKNENSNTTETQIEELDSENRIKEIAKMLSGNNPSEVAYLNAKELLSLTA